MARGADCQIYNFNVSRQSLFFISGCRDGSSSTQQIEIAPGASLINSTVRWFSSLRGVARYEPKQSHSREIASPASLYNFEMIHRLAMTNPLHGGERKKVYGKLVTDLIACSAHGRIYYFILSRQSLSFIFGRRDGSALTQGGDHLYQIFIPEYFLFIFMQDN